MLERTYVPRCFPDSIVGIHMRSLSASLIRAAPHRIRVDFDFHGNREVFSAGFSPSTCPNKSFLALGGRSVRRGPSLPHSMRIYIHITCNLYIHTHNWLGERSGAGGKKRKRKKKSRWEASRAPPRPSRHRYSRRSRSAARPATSSAATRYAHTYAEQHHTWVYTAHNYVEHTPRETSSCPASSRACKRTDGRTDGRTNKSHR